VLPRKFAAKIFVMLPICESGRRFFGATICAGLNCLMEAGGSLEGVGDAWADVCWADVAFEFGLLHELGGLFAGTAEEE
jgi:hypothetical protein